MRLSTIDMLRGLAILAMILIHSTAFFLSSKAAFNIWNYSQFAVPVFVFCSTYLFFYKDSHLNSNELLPFFKKRLFRLLTPYYVFLSVYFFLMFIFDRAHLSLEFILRQAVLATSSNDISWAVLLFIYLSFITPLLSYLFVKKRAVFNLFLVVSILSGIFVMLYKSPVNFKLVMWLPWSLIAFFALYFVKNKDKDWFYAATSVTTFCIFTITLLILTILQHSLNHYDNKYPPNLYHLSYGAFWITAMHFYFEREIIAGKMIQTTLNFFSTYSYSLFFIHFLIIYILTHAFDYKRLGWIGFSAVVIVVSVALQKILLLFNTQTGKVLK